MHHLKFYRNKQVSNSSEINPPKKPSDHELFDEVSFNDELLILVDENDRVTGFDEKLTVHQGKGVLHRAFSIFLFSPCGQILLQQRSASKFLWPLFWSNTVCSHPRKGESYEVATARRLEEELGLVAELNFLFRFQYTATYQSVGSENELCQVFAGWIPLDTPIIANQNEVADWKWVGIDQLETLIQAEPEQFTPWLLMEWSQMKARGDLEFADSEKGHGAD